MLLKDLGYNSSVRDKVFEKIWIEIDDNYEIKPSPLKNANGNVIVLPDEIYWECDKIVKLNKEGFNQKWTYYRPSLFATKYDLVKTGCLIYNETWSDKMLRGEVKKRNDISKLIQLNQASVEQVSEYNWKSIDLARVGIWSVKNKNDVVLGLYLSFDKYFDDIWKEEKEQQTLIYYKDYDNKELIYDKVLSIADMVDGKNDISKDDMNIIYLGLCKIFKPVDTMMKRISGSVKFDFGETIFIDE